MRTQVVIIGGGPAGLLLGQLLHLSGIDTVVLERRSRAHVLGRVRAGVLEQGTVDLLTRAGAGARLRAEGLRHDGTLIADGRATFRVDFGATGHGVTVYGQTEVTRDLYDAREAAGAPVLHGVDGVTIHDADSAAPFVTYRRDGAEHSIDCAIVAGCDGFHGVAQPTIPASVRSEYQKVYPFAWLGMLSQTRPLEHELVYAASERGFALCSMRSPTLSRYYIQCDAGDAPDAMSDDAYWAELRRRLPPEMAETLDTGPAVERSMAPLRSFVCEPMQWGRLFLCGDAAHIVPPTGAKGLNLAASDVHYLHETLVAWFGGDAAALATYSPRALARVWKAERFSWWFTSLMHRFPDQSPFDRRMQDAELDLLRGSAAAQAAMAENYVGLPL